MKLRHLIISDTHCGHRWGLTPARWIRQDPKDPAVKWQWWLLEVWRSVVYNCGNPHVLILLGDTCDGSHDKAGQLLTNDTNDQIAMAVEMLRMLIGDKTTKIYGITGSEYHTNRKSGENLDRAVVERLDGSFEGHTLTYSVPNTPWVFQFHHSIAGSFENPDNAMRKELDRAIMANNDAKTPVPDILVRGHLHRYRCTDYGKQQVVITPCFQFSSEFIKKNNPSALPTIGAVVIEVDTESTFQPVVKKYTFGLDSIVAELRPLRGFDEQILKNMEEKERKAEIKRRKHTELPGGTRVIPQIKGNKQNNAVLIEIDRKPRQR
jgi:hypothetical protein